MMRRGVLFIFINSIVRYCAKFWHHLVVWGWLMVICRFLDSVKLHEEEKGVQQGLGSLCRGFRGISICDKPR